MKTPAKRFLVARDRPPPELDPHLVALEESRSPDEWITAKCPSTGSSPSPGRPSPSAVTAEADGVDVHVLDPILEVWDQNELIETVARTTKGGIRKKRAAAR
ncbi:MAG: hypothetical protein ACYDH6_10900 [Acidimicrobiales bacterium]